MPASDPRTDRKPEAHAENEHGPDGWFRIFLDRAHEPEQENDHRDREGGVLRIDEHVAVKLRA